MKRLLPIRPSRVLSAALLAGFSVGEVTAQVEPDTVVVTALSISSLPPGGVFLVGAGGRRVPVPVTGLRADLIGSRTAEPAGAGCVLIDERSGDLVVGEHALTGESVDLHVISLSGSHAVTDVRYPLGTSTTQEVGIDQMAWLGEDIVFCARGDSMAGGPMAGHILGVFRPQAGPPGAAGTVVPIPLTSIPPGRSNALAVDPVREVIYFANHSPTTSTIYRVPLPTGPAAVDATAVLSLSGVVRSLAVDADGDLLVGASVGASALLRIDPWQRPASVSPVPMPASVGNALDIDNASGVLILADTPNGDLYRVTPAGAAVRLGGVGAYPTGVAIRQSVEEYGPWAPAPDRADWVLRGNPGGAPRVGGPGFSVTAEAVPGAAFSVLALGLGEGYAPVPSLGIDLLLDPASVVTSLILPPGARATVPLPIPSDPGLVGAALFAQTMHARAGSWIGSRGLRITVLP